MKLSSFFVRKPCHQATRNQWPDNARHLIALKLHALKQNPGKRDQDYSDIVRVARSRAAQIPPDELKALCEKYGPNGIYEQIRTALSYPMPSELPEHLKLNLPQGEWLEFDDAPLPGEALREWRLRRYLLWRQRDPEMKERLCPEPEPFVFLE
jgi:hypothetical protein